MYTDSQIVLGYIFNSTRRFYVYVANRIQRIRNSTQPEQWTYINTNLNPADEGTRSIPASRMPKSLWLNGPEFLKECPDVICNNPQVEFPLIDASSDKEIRPEIQVAKSSVSDQEPFDATTLFEKYSESFKSSYKACKGWHKCSEHKEQSAKEEATRFILLHVQRKHFANEIECLRVHRKLPRDSSILTLTPFLDSHGLLRVGGRLNKAPRSCQADNHNPIIIPKRCHIGLLIVRRCHVKVQHQGRHLTEGSVMSSGYWILGRKRLISSYIHECVTCRRLRGKLGTQKMTDLTVARITPFAPFTYVGVDAFGPWQVTTRRARGGAANS
ncbi:uncharacterized protein LOC132550446 [Ylistrum balloti]|uniref:uncharacterized protein LOC132550446 n=1 Tax=Ylistrum balloti TaxID=509963 RepID=UPI002905CA24|nr:uncharacterized protein LOC132550446 [Ylistrum balloti]